MQQETGKDRADEPDVLDQLNELQSAELLARMVNDSGDSKTAGMAAFSILSGLSQGIDKHQLTDADAQDMYQILGENNRRSRRKILKRLLLFLVLLAPCLYALGIDMGLFPDIAFPAWTEHTAFLLAVALPYMAASFYLLLSVFFAAINLILHWGLRRQIVRAYPEVYIQK